jgi:hypothetical protein
MYGNKKAKFNFNFFEIRITAAAAAAAVFPLARVVLRCCLSWGRNAKALHGRLPRSPPQCGVWARPAESVTAILKKVSIPTSNKYGVSRTDYSAPRIRAFTSTRTEYTVLCTDTSVTGSAILRILYKSVAPWRHWRGVVAWSHARYSRNMQVPHLKYCDLPLPTKLQSQLA